MNGPAMSDPGLCYLDYNATTRIDPRVLDALLPYLTDLYGNPSSLHHFGAQVGARIEQARAQVARLIGARDSEIIFTSGGTEADNLALRGVLAARPQKRRLVISAVEHHAIFATAEALEHEGVSVTRISVDQDGRLDLAALQAALRPDTALVSLMLANNESGVIFPLAEASRIVHAAGSLLHTDAVNAAGKLAISVDSLGVDLLSLSAHKIHGPKGCGALYLRRGTPLRPMIVGGPQERGRRGGTSNAAGIIGLGAACESAGEALADAALQQRITTLRDRLEQTLTEKFDAVVVGGRAERLHNTCCVCFPGVSAEAVLLLLSQAGVCASSGAACSSGSLEPSHVLQAMAIAPEIAQGQIRFSMGRYTTAREIDHVLELIPGILQKISAASP